MLESDIKHEKMGTQRARSFAFGPITRNGDVTVRRIFEQVSGDPARKQERQRK